jgi:hypothetical protein
VAPAALNIATPRVGRYGEIQNRELTPMNTNRRHSFASIRSLSRHSDAAADPFAVDLLAFGCSMLRLKLYFASFSVFSVVKILPFFSLRLGAFA